MTEEQHKIKAEDHVNQAPITASDDIAPVPGRYRVMRRNGKVTSFDLNKIVVAMTKAFLSLEGSSAAASTRIHNEVQILAEQVYKAI